MDLVTDFLKMKIFTVTSIFVGLLVISPLTHAATYTDITGTWTGTASGTQLSCSNPADDGPFSDPVTMVFSNQNNGNFDVSVFTAGGSDTQTGTGFFLSASAFQFMASDAFGSVTVNGTVNGNTISFSFSGTDDCMFSGTGNVTRSTADVVVSVATPGSTLTDAILANTQFQALAAGIGARASGGALRGGGGGSNGSQVGENQFSIGGATGMNAGDGITVPYGIWGNYSYTDYENDFAGTDFDGASHAFLGGIDFSFWENTILGVAFGYDHADIDTTFNGGHQDADSFTVAPYFGALLTDTLSLDFTVGYSNVDYEQFRTLPGTTTRVTSSPNADRWFGALNLNGVTYRGNWILGSRIGALWAKSVIGSFTESNGAVVAESRTKISTGSIAGDVAYSYQEFEPFLNLSYQYDFQLTEIAVAGAGSQPSNDPDDILMTVGVRYYENNGISGNLEYSKRFARDNFDEDRISLTVRADF